MKPKYTHPYIWKRQRFQELGPTVKQNINEKTNINNYCETSGKHSWKTFQNLIRI